MRRERDWFSEEGRRSFEALELSNDSGLTGWIYYIEERDTPESPVKIGFSKDLLHRIVLLQTGNARPLQVRQCFVGWETVERCLHRRWWEARLAGEWFGGPYRAAILAMADGVAEAQIAGAEELANERLWATMSDARQRVERETWHHYQRRFESATAL